MPQKEFIPITNAEQYDDVKETAALLNVSVSFLNKARITGGGPPFTKFGKTVRYQRGTTLAWAAAQTHRSTSESRGVA